MEIKHYVTDDGRCPFDEWFDKLKDKKAKHIILGRLKKLRDTGQKGEWNPIKGTDGELFELKIRHGPAYRLYCAEDGETLIILLCAGDKSTQKKDIKKAKEYWDDHKS